MRGDFVPAAPPLRARSRGPLCPTPLARLTRAARSRRRRDIISGVNSKYIWLNGEMLETSRATVPFLTVGLHYGVGVFEGIRAYDTARGPAVFRLRDHLERM